MAELEKRIKQAEQQLDLLMAEREERRGRKTIPCSKCEKRTRVSKLTYYAWMWYREPYGCTGGDYWSEGEGHFVCPKCSAVNRTYRREWIAELKPYFDKTVKVYESRSGGYFSNEQTLALFKEAEHGSR